MMKRILTLVLAAALLAGLCVSAASADDAAQMFVYTENGKTLNLREFPSTDAPVLLKIPFGAEVWIDENLGNGWCHGHYAGEFGYMQTRFLQRSQPTSKPTADPGKTKEETDAKKIQEELNKELKTLTSVEPFLIEARPTRSTGWVNFRTGPNANAARIGTFSEGKQLKVIGETTKWYQVVDPDTNKSGYVSKKYVTVVPQTATPVQTTVEPDTKQQLGKLNVNGAFALQCKLPEGYTLNTVDVKGEKIIASVNPEDVTKPTLYLNVSFNEAYADVEKLNDLNDEELAILEQSFTEMNDVEISYRETAYGTKLLVAREVGSDTDFVDILTIYKGYMIEFNMTPSAAMASQTLTDDQVRMCIDFLSDVDFVPVS